MGYNITIVTTNQSSSQSGTPPQNITTATRTIQITDSVTNQAVNGNGLTVVYSHVYKNSLYSQNSQNNFSVQIQGSSLQIYSGIISQTDVNSGTNIITETDTIVSFDLSTQTSGGGGGGAVNDLTLQSPTVVNESATGASDGSITVNATGSNTPFQYSINGGSTYVIGANTFYGLTGGTYNISVKDSLNNVRTETVTVGTSANILVSDPSLYTNVSYPCNFNASHNPIYFTFQRPAAFANQPYYKIRLYITFYNYLTSSNQTVHIDCTPNSSGLAKCDISSFLKSLLTTNDTFNYDVGTYNDTFQCISYTVAYAQSYQGYQGSIININKTYYVVLGAFQIQEQYSGNYLNFMPTPGILGAKFISDFGTPVLNQGFPFCLSVINPGYSTNLQYVVTQYDINKNVIGAFGTMNLPNTPGLTRINLTGPTASNVYYITIQLQDASGYLSNPFWITVNQVCVDIPVYIRWKQSKGGWAYYLFGYNQEVTLDIQNMMLTKGYISNYEKAIGAERIIRKDASNKITVHAVSIPKNDLLGIQNMHLSPEVQVLTTPDPVTGAYRWKRIIVNMGSYQMYNTRWDAFDISFTYNEPSLNVVTQ